MPVYKGVLQKLSEGSVIAPEGTGAYITHWGRIVRTGVDRRIYRAFVEIGGKHVRNVVLTPYHDQVLADSLGEEVALSVLGRPGPNQVIAIQTRRGVDRPHVLRVVVSMIRDVVLYWLLAFLVALFLLAVDALWPNGFVYVLGNLVVIFILVWPFIQYVRIFRAWGALSSRPSLHPSPY